MKRYLKKDRHQMSAWEKENLWNAIGNQSGDRAARSGSRSSSIRPVFGLVSAVAVLVVVGAWWIGTTDSDRGFGSQSPGVVVLPPEMKFDEVQDRDPAADLRESASREKIEANRVFLEETEDVVGEVAAAPAPAVEAMAAPIAAEPKVAKASGSMDIKPVPAIGVIHGRVLDRATGQGLPHATVLLRGTAHSTFTDASGAFEFTGLQPGTTVTLQVSVAGYAASRTEVAIPQAGAVEVALKLDAVVQDADAVVEETVVRNALERKEKADAVLDTGIRPKPGELYVRGGRESGTALKMAEQRVSAPHATVPSSPTVYGSVTGGTKPPNGEQVELMYFEHTGVNPFIATEDDSLSTFALDVDNASWTLARSYLRRGMMPPKDAIRVEEFVNAFDAGWRTHNDDPFDIHSDGSASRFGDGYHLLRVGLVGKTVADDQRKAANLVFVIDISGSMNRDNRLGLVKKALHILLDELQEGDRVGIVVYGSSGRILLEPTDIERRKTIEQAIDALGPGGSTNAFEGLDLAFSMARRTYEAGKVNRLILCSDGVANNGATTEAEEMLERIRKSSDEGITLSTIGFGMGNYNDVLMEKLANQGDGNYYYVDELKEAERVFRENLTGLLQTIAREVKVQVEFDKNFVSRWRLLGYENRDVADRDFRNDAVDAGEVGSGHQVTALYEIKLGPQPAQVANIRQLTEDNVVTDRRAPLRVGTIRLRHEAPAHDTARAGEVQEIESPILMERLTGDFAVGSIWLRTQAVVAEFAEILRGSFWAKESRLADLIPIADGLAAEMPGDEQVAELAELIRLAVDIEEGEDQDDEIRPMPIEKEVRSR